jgi:hypothetical protein
MRLIPPQSLFRAALATLGALGALAAQRPSLWSTIPMPANGGTPNAIGTSVTVATPSAFHLYSGITKQWTVVPVAAGATLFQANDYVIVRDGALIHGFATHTGVVDTLTTSGNATVVSGPAASSWVTLVADGTQAYAFGAFHGRWETQALSAPNPAMVASRLIGLVLDGTTAYGVSAHHGTFVPVAVDNNAALRVVGEAEVGTANSPDVLRAFSAQQNLWQVQAVPNAAGNYQQNEYATMWAGNQVWAVSGLTGTLASYTASTPILGVNGDEGVAWFQDGNQVVCYGAGRGTFAALPTSNPVVATDYHFALIQDGGVVTPYSALTGTFGPGLPGMLFVGSNDEVGYASDGNAYFGYSPIRNRWSLAPIAAPNSVSLVRSALVLGDPTGYWAMSSRHGTWRFQASSLPGNHQAPNTGACFVALDGNADVAHVFDARLDRWTTVTAQAPLTVRISRHTVMVHDGQTAWGFGQPSGEWYELPMSAFPSRFDVASSIGSVRHGNDLSVYSVQGSFSYTGRYPEFTQAINLGQTLRMHQVGAPGSLLLFAIGFQPAFVDARPVVDGVVYVDLATATAILWPQAIDGDGILDLDFTVPNVPWLVGLQLHMQNLVLPPTGQPWLSTSVAPVLF